MSKSLAAFVQAHSRALVFIVASLSIAGVIFGVGLPISILPQTNFPRIVILVDNGIMPVDQMLVTVTRPIEQAIRIVPGIENIRTVTSRGASEINAFFRWDVDILDALHLVQGQISQILPTLPPTVRFNVHRLTFSVFPMVGFSITSHQRSLTELYTLAYYQIAPRLYRLPGVAETRIVGGRPEEYHIVVKPEQLNAYRFSLSKVVDAVRNNNVLAPAGMLQENFRLYLTTVDGLVRSKGDIENIVVDVVKGTPVRIRDLATVEPGEKPIYNVVTADGEPAVLVNVLQQPDGNSVAIASAVNRELVEIKKGLPPDIKLSIFYDQSILVRESITGVAEAIVIGLLLSIAVLVVFLKNWRTTLVAAVVIPIATLIAIVVMKIFKMSFNLMTLGGIAASIGVVIDDAIVMVENIMVHLSMGQSPREAARSAIVELTPALTGSTLTPIVVFAPLVFLGGITAVFFRSLALTLVAALFASLVLAICFTPVLAGFFLKPRQVEPGAAEAFTAGEGRLLRRLSGIHERALHWSLAHPKAILGVSVMILAGSVGLYNLLGTGFLPDLNEAAFVLDFIMPPGTSLEESKRVLGHIEKFLKETPEVESYSLRVGARLALAIAEPNTGDFLVKLKTKRSRTLDEVIDELREKINRAEPVISVEFPHVVEDLVGDLTWSPEPIEVRAFVESEQVGRSLASRVTQFLPKVRGVVDVINQVEENVIGPQIEFKVDREKAERGGFSVADVAEIEAAVMDGVEASTMIQGERQIGLRVRYPRSYRQTREELERMVITSPSGVTMPLGSLADTRVESDVTEIRRENLRRVFTVSARLSGRDLGSAMDEIQGRLPKEVGLPPGLDIDYGGLYKVQQESFRTLTGVLLMSILLIFIILTFEFQTFSHPIAILAATLLCSFGALLALGITRTTLNISSFMGAIMVVGIVHKNGILMLDSEKHYSSLGLPLVEAIFQAGRRRLRPILMTALATIFGMLPLAIGLGSASRILQPLAIAVIGGVAVSMVLSLLITPVLFYLLRRRGW
ncbi:MAG: efflux RND transporter permease subunit [Acidobacteria bacterium]|nr:efflux RND transporter permease subunit [Acidobacteriota bacterium]